MYPEILVSNSNDHAWQDYGNIKNELNRAIIRLGKQKTIVTVDCYPGVRMEELKANLVSVMEPAYTIFADDLYYSSDKVTDMIKFHLTTDRVFGKISLHNFGDFLDDERLEEARSAISNIDSGLIIIYGSGATLYVILIFSYMLIWQGGKSRKDIVIMKFQIGEQTTIMRMRLERLKEAISLNGQLRTDIKGSCLKK